MPPVLAVVAVVGVASVVLAPAALSSAGFTAAGVKAGSYAASLMSGIGNVSAGSTFAALQSAGAAGLAMTTKSIVGVTGGAVGGAVLGVWRLFMK